MREIKLVMEKLKDIFWKIKLLIRKNFRIYKTYYDIGIVGGEKDCWWSNDLNKWVPYETKCNLSSSRQFSNKRKAFKHFTELTERGIKCRMNDRKIKFGKAWYFEKEWFSVDQDNFGDRNKIKK